MIEGLAGMTLDDFIGAFTSKGQLDSEGTFEIDSLAALRKTLASCLPEPHFYLFQLLQSLVKSDCREIRVAIGRRENRISFQDPQSALVDLDLIAKAFNGGLSVSSSRPEDLLVSGLVTSMGSDVDCAEYHAGAEKIQITVNGLRREKLPKPVSNPCLVLKRDLERGLSFSWSRIWGARKEEFRVRKAFEYTPVDISIAGLPVQARESWRRACDEEERFALLEVGVFGTDTPNHRAERTPELKPLASDPGYWVPLLKEPKDKQAAALAPTLLRVALDSSRNPLESVTNWDNRHFSFTLTNSPKALSEIVFVRNGLRIDAEERDFGIPGLLIVAPANDLSVDASGYRLVQNEAYEKRISEAQATLKSINETHLASSRIREALDNAGYPSQEVLAHFPWL